MKKNKLEKEKKYPRYQDYVIKDGKFVGEFEEMYRDYNDPWRQSVEEEWTSEKSVALEFIQKLGVRRVIELGCGLGHFTKRIKGLGVDVQGIDISKSAIQKAKSTYPDCAFVAGDILDYSIYQDFQPEIIVMAEITWYVLDKLDEFIDFLKTHLPNTYLIHLLTTYPEGVQEYGKGKFTNLQQILSYFEANYLEWGEISAPEMKGCKRTYFIGRWDKK